MEMPEYRADDKMKRIIDREPMLLMAMSRFGISLGFGDKTVSEICQAHDVDTATFLAVCNFISFGKDTSEGIDVRALMRYLRNAHTYFLEFCLPQIRRRLIDAIDCSGADEVSMLILKFFDENTSEVRRHMDHENEHVFVYVESLLAGRIPKDYNIDVFASGHHRIDEKLNELKDIIIRYIPQRENNKLNAVLFDLINCRQDLISHCAVENRLFVPAVKLLERAVLDSPNDSEQSASPGAPAPSPAELGNRERDIIRCVAQGLSNKEIADKLCISVYTVTTHRRNIAAKLQIHSTAGLTIYAVLNGIITIDK